jgi:hypothetical protein
MKLPTQSMTLVHGVLASSISALTLHSPVRTTYFNIQELCILPTLCIYVFLMDLTIMSDCFLYRR